MRLLKALAEPGNSSSDRGASRGRVDFLCLNQHIGKLFKATTCQWSMIEQHQPPLHEIVQPPDPFVLDHVAGQCNGVRRAVEQLVRAASRNRFRRAALRDYMRRAAAVKLAHGGDAFGEQRISLAQLAILRRIRSL